MTPIPKQTLAREAHSMFHQNAKGLHREFQISMEEARAIVRAYPICSHHNGGCGLGLGVNPRGLKTNETWQMDVTHVAEFGRMKYVHVTVDTYSNFIWATAHTGEKARQVERHLSCCFAVMGVPQRIKTDNGPAYCSQRIKQFMQMWGIEHVTGIPNSPTGQAIVERANGTLKRYLGKYTDIREPQERLLRCLFVLNHLCVFGESKVPAVIRHHEQEKDNEKQDVWVKYRDPKTGQWQGPAKVLYWGRGYLCVSTPTGSLWVPAKWAKAAVLDGTPQPTERRRPSESGDEAADHPSTDIS